MLPASSLKVPNTKKRNILQKRLTHQTPLAMKKGRFPVNLIRDEKHSEEGEV
jgi:hypothetical protein